MMNLSAIFCRLKLGMTSAVLACVLMGGNANADIEPGSLFFIATDESRNGVSEAYILDLELNFLTTDPAGFGSIMDAGLANWLGDPNASKITWGVFGVGNTSGSAAEARIASTVNPADLEPMQLSQNQLLGAIEAGKGVVSRFNGNAASNSLAAPLGSDGFPRDFGDNWNDNANEFLAAGDLDELLPMYIFGIDDSFAPFDPVAVDGLWALDADTGSLAFAPVPVPAALWMFGAAIVGLFGARRRSTG